MAPKIKHEEIRVKLLSRTDNGGRILWENLENTAVRIGDWEVIIPKGFRFDFASVPRCLKWLLSDQSVYSCGPMLHDYLYRVQHPKASADGALYDVLRHDGVAAWERWVIVSAVALFGGAAYRANGKRHERVS